VLNAVTCMRPRLLIPSMTFRRSPGPGDRPRYAVDALLCEDASYGQRLTAD